ncbi:PfkB family carbohydrate kinase [Prauserella muralis]|uniref:Ribokinase n=1 Tax=Prauserella muralis TaxID=588067 RepID=A0A2V4AHR2_9PSEU|nr:PfkB family carbohydrate kinase [Prauserella muralis]PXY19455.1 ribokinase [Prauserella muralis]
MAVEVVVVGQLARDLVLTVGEAPGAGQSADVRHRREMLGGKGANQAVGLAQLGTRVALVGVAGDDDVGREMLAQARRDGIDTSATVRRDDTETALIVDVVDDDGHWRYLEHIPRPTLVGRDEIAAASGMIAEADTVVLQLQQPGQTALAAARLARASGTRVVLDGAPHQDADVLLADADVVRADAREGEQLTGRSLDTVAGAERAAADLLGSGPSLAVLEVAGEGDLFADAERTLFLPHGEAEVVDTTGAGDALIAGLTATLTRGGSTREAAEAAVAAAGATVGHAGGRPHLSPRA